MVTTESKWEFTHSQSNMYFSLGPPCKSIPNYNKYIWEPMVEKMEVSELREGGDGRVHYVWVFSGDISTLLRVSRLLLNISFPSTGKELVKSAKFSR